MKTKKNCKIVQDLLPNYIECLTNEETNSFLNEHLRECEECQNLLEEMKKQFNVRLTGRENRDVEYIKKFENKISHLRLFVIVMLMIVLLETAVIFAFRYKRMKNELEDRYQLESYNSSFTWNKIAEYEEELQQLRKELSKYDESYKEQIDNPIVAEVESISEENGRMKLRVKRISNTVKTEHDVFVSENTEIVKDNDIVDVSLLKEGQFLYVHCISDEIGKFPEKMTNVTAIEILTVTSLEAEITEINANDDIFAISVNSSDDSTYYVYISEETKILKNDVTVDKSELQIGQKVEIRYPGLNGGFPQTLSGVTKIEIVE